jgi:gem associated protein 6
MDIVMGHAVKSLVISSSNVCTGQEEIFASVSVNIDREEAEARKKKLKSWLCKNRIPVEEDGELLILKDALQIHPPYGKDQCLSGNEIVLGRVQDLIATMPDNVDM